MAQTIYGNAIDLENAKKALGSGYNYVDTSKGGNFNLTNSDIVVGGAGATGGIANSGNALRLAGLDRDGTEAEIKKYASSLKPQVQSASVPQQPQPDIQAQMARLKQAQIDQAVVSFGKAKDQSLSNLQKEKAAIAPEYYTKRNVADSQAKLQARNFAEFMSQRGSGSVNSGANAQATLSDAGRIQGQVGALNRDEASANIENTRRVANTQNAFESDVAGAKAGAETNYLNQLIAEMQQQRQLDLQKEQFAKQFGLSEAGLTGVYNNNPTLAATNANRDFALSEAGLTGNYNNSQTMQARQYQNSIEQWNKQYEAEQAAKAFEQQLALQQLAISKQNANTSAYKASTPSSSNYLNIYNSWIDENSGLDGVNQYNNLEKHKDDYINDMGLSNYNKAIEAARNKYYQEIINNWRGEEKNLKQELASDEEFYKARLGLKNFNTLMGK